MKNYKKYLLEKDLEFTRNPDDVDAFKPGVIDISKPVKSTDDFIKPDPKSPVLDYYGQGKRFNIVDSADLYEITKIIKDLVDKYMSVQSFGYSIDVKNNSVVFTGTTETQDIKDENLIKFINNNIKSLVDNRYKDGYKFDSKVIKLDGGPEANRYQLIMTISGKGENPTENRYGKEQDEDLIDDLVKNKNIIKEDRSKKRHFLGVFKPGKDQFQRVIKNIDPAKVEKLVDYTESMGDKVEMVGSNVWGVTKESEKNNEAVWQYLDGDLMFVNTKYDSIYDDYIRKNF
ncbi:MAG: hypothetical protein ACOC33_03655 [bacterium]